MILIVFAARVRFASLPIWLTAKPCVCWLRILRVALSLLRRRNLPASEINHVDLYT